MGWLALGVVSISTQQASMAGPTIPVTKVVWKSWRFSATKWPHVEIVLSTNSKFLFPQYRAWHRKPQPGKRLGRFQGHKSLIAFLTFITSSPLPVSCYESEQVSIRPMSNLQTSNMCTFRSQVTYAMEDTTKVKSCKCIVLAHETFTSTRAGTLSHIQRGLKT